MIPWEVEWYGMDRLISLKLPKEKILQTSWNRDKVYFLMDILT